MARKREPCPHVVAGTKVFKRNACRPCYILKRGYEKCRDEGMGWEWIELCYQSVLKSGTPKDIADAFDKHWREWQRAWEGARFLRRPSRLCSECVGSGCVACHGDGIIFTDGNTKDSLMAALNEQRKRKGK